MLAHPPDGPRDAAEVTMFMKQYVIRHLFVRMPLLGLKSIVMGGAL